MTPRKSPVNAGHIDEAEEGDPGTGSKHSLQTSGGWRKADRALLDLLVKLPVATDVRIALIALRDTADPASQVIFSAASVARELRMRRPWVTARIQSLVRLGVLVRTGQTPGRAFAYKIHRPPLLQGRDVARSAGRVPVYSSGQVQGGDLSTTVDTCCPLEKTHPETVEKDPVVSRIGPPLSGGGEPPPQPPRGGASRRHQHPAPGGPAPQPQPRHEKTASPAGAVPLRPRPPSDTPGGINGTLLPSDAALGALVTAYGPDLRTAGCDSVVLLKRMSKAFGYGADVLVAGVLTLRRLERGGSVSRVPSRRLAAIIQGGPLPDVLAEVRKVIEAKESHRQPALF